jgi:hypothetical protein
MPWNYANVRPSQMPPCPICHEAGGVTGGGLDHNRYRCAACGTWFEAWFEAWFKAEPQRWNPTPILPSMNNPPLNCRCAVCDLNRMARP